MTELGLTLFDENKNLINSRKFDNALVSYQLLKSGGKLKEIEQFVETLQSFDSVLSNDPNIVYILRKIGLHSELMLQDQIYEIQRSKLSILVRSNFFDNEIKAVQALREFAIELSSNKVKEVSEKMDLHIIQSINALDELDKIINLVGARMREWYGLHFPELDNLVQNLTTYAEIIRKTGLRENIAKEQLEQIGIPDKKIEIIMDAARRSKGGDMTTENFAIIKTLAEEVITQTQLRIIVSDHIEAAMELTAPNVKELLTASIGARMIARAGGISRLAMLPASTIQVLGAEKALFRSLKTGARPPKHGLIFQHPLIHSAPKWQRGKIARALASKLVISARIDVYRKGVKEVMVSDSLNRRIAEIREKYKEPSMQKGEYGHRDGYRQSSFKRDKYTKKAKKGKKQHRRRRF